MDALRETIEQVGKEVENDVQKENQQVDSSTTQEETQEQENINQELEKDENFQKEVPQEYNKNPQWRKLYWKRKEAERKQKEYEDRIAELEEQLTQTSEPDIDDDKLVELAKQKGYSLNKLEQKQEKLAELDQLLQNARTPEERQWLQNYAEAIRTDTEKRFEERYGQMFQDMQGVLVDYRLNQSEKHARDLIKQINSKYGTQLDYDKDIDPELVKMIKNSNGKLNPKTTDIYQLTREYLADKGIELGKKLSEKQQRELNETKKKAAMETSSPTTSSGIDDSKMSLKEILEDSARKEGYGSF